MLQREFVQCLIDSQQLIIHGRSGYIEGVKIYALVASAMTFGVFPPGAVDQNAAHRLGRSAEEMLAILERGGLIANQAQPSFVHQRSGLQRLPGSFPSNL